MDDLETEGGKFTGFDARGAPGLLEVRLFPVMTDGDGALSLKTE
jgi:hypothetical protein